MGRGGGGVIHGQIGVAKGVAQRFKGPSNVLANANWGPTLKSAVVEADDSAGAYVERSTQQNGVGLITGPIQGDDLGPSVIQNPPDGNLRNVQFRRFPLRRDREAAKDLER